MDDILFAFTGVILQVLGLIAAFSSVALEVVKLILKLMPKERLRSSDESEEPRQ